METTQDIKERLKVIIDDDCTVIDYLSDLPDREPLIQLQKFVSFGNGKPNAILHKARDGQYILVLYKPPFEGNTGWNKMALFSHTKLHILYSYFQRWLEGVPENDKDLISALKEILDLLEYQKNIEIDKNAQANHMG